MAYTMKSMKNTKPQLLIAREYLEEAVRAVNAAKTHINLLTMVMANDDVTEPLIDALCAAAERGVTVNVAVDIFAYAEIGGHLRFHTKVSPQVRPVSQLETRLKASGAKFLWLGQYSLSIFSGRTHSKWLIVDDTLYSFGGVNLFKRGINHADFMLKVHDAKLARTLSHEQQRIAVADRHESVYRSRSLPTAYGTLMIDGGLFGESLIYRRVCALTRQAKRVTYVSQYCPTGTLGRLLKRTDSRLYFNPWNKARSFDQLLIRLGGRLSGHTTAYEHTPYLHAKFMLFELTDGQMVAICGSHNFSHAGVWLGTREIALETQSPDILQQLQRFLNDCIA